MILILSTTVQEKTTEEVIDWLEKIGAAWIRLNGEDLNGGALLHIRQPGDIFALTLDGGSPAIHLTEVAVVWYRRWTYEGRHEVAIPLSDGTDLDAGSRLAMIRHPSGEFTKLSAFLFSKLSGARWLSAPGSTKELDKLRVLELATELGMEIPATLVTTSKSSVEQFARTHGRIVTKAISDAPMLFAADKFYALYTAELCPEDVARLPEVIFPSLFQERLDKEFELRIFFLAGDLYAMAIFSQRDRQTRDDFRNYNYTKPNRSVPFILPKELAGKIIALMETLALETGSIDMVKTTDGRYVFLEVNPVGQFGMVSKPCNYYLEEKVAAFLTQRDEQ